MCKLSATTKDITFAALVLFFSSSSFTLMAEQPTNQQSTGAAPEDAMISGAAGATIAAEGELKATVRTFQSGNPSAVYRYYWWHDNCYVRYQSDTYQVVPLEYCHQQH